MSAEQHPLDRSTSPEPRAGRRRLLRLAGAAVAGAAASALTTHGTQAADGDPVTLGQTSTAGSRTRADYTGASEGQAFLFQAGSFYTGTTGYVSAALAGWTSSNTMTTGVFGYSDRSGGKGVYGRADGPGTGIGVHGVADNLSGHGVRAENPSGTALNATGKVAIAAFSPAASSAGVSVQASGSDSPAVLAVAVGASASGVRATSFYSSGVSASGLTGVEAGGVLASLRLNDVNPPAPTRAFVRRRGEVDMDTNGDLWVCVGAGNPGTWRKVAGPNATGSLHAITPVRVYDSRKPTASPLATGSHRTISVANSIDGTGAVLATDVVPAGATAIMYNVTVVNTVASGWLSVNPGGVASTATSTINWGSSGTVLANGTMVALDANRGITVACGGTGASTNFIIDVTGYYR